MHDDGPDGRGLPIALVCPEHRLRLVLRLALEGAGYRVRDWSSAPSQRQGNDVVAAVVDLDSSRLRPETVVDRLSTWGLPGATPLLLIFVGAGLLALKDAPRRVVATIPVVFFLLYLPYTFYMEHYLVAIVTPMIALVVLGAERIVSIWSQPTLRSKAERAVVVALVLTAVIVVWMSARTGPTANPVVIPPDPKSTAK